MPVSVALALAVSGGNKTVKIQKRKNEYATGCRYFLLMTENPCWRMKATNLSFIAGSGYDLPRIIRPKAKGSYNNLMN